MAATKKAAPKEEKAFEPKVVSCDGYNALNVRKSPSMAAEIVRELKDGAQVSAAPAKRGWSELEDGGYVRTCYLA